MAYSIELTQRQREEREALADRQREERRNLTRKHEAEKLAEKQAKDAERKAEKQAEKQAKDAERKAEKLAKDAEKSAPAERARLCRLLLDTHADASAIMQDMGARCTNDVERVVYLKTVLGENALL